MGKHVNVLKQNSHFYLRALLMSSKLSAVRRSILILEEVALPYTTLLMTFTQRREWLNWIYTVYSTTVTTKAPHRMRWYGASAAIFDVSHQAIRSWSYTWRPGHRPLHLLRPSSAFLQHVVYGEKKFRSVWVDFSTHEICTWRLI